MENTLQLFVYCPQCGTIGGSWKNEQEFVCPHCDFHYFHNVAAAVGLIAYNQEGKILFLRRNQNPSKGKLGLPGGFINPGESVEIALKREVYEEIGAQIGSITYLRGFPNTYIWGGVLYNTCDLYFSAVIQTPESEWQLQSTEVQNQVWIDLGSLKEEDLAFVSLKSLIKSLKEI